MVTTSYGMVDQDIEYNGWRITHRRVKPGSDTYTAYKDNAYNRSTVICSPSWEQLKAHLDAITLKRLNNRGL
jgi:hypothetical protein